MSPIQQKEHCAFTSAAGKVGKLVFARLARGCDLIEGLEDISKKYEIEGGCVMSCIGAFDEVVLHTPPPRGTKESFAPPVRVLGPLQLLNCQGIIGKSEEGKTHIHLHATVFCNDENRIYGGHLSRGENRVSVTVEIVIATVEDINISFKMDPSIDAAQPTFYPKKV